VANPTKTTERGIDDMEEVPGVHGDVTNNDCPMPAPGEMERGITQEPLAITGSAEPQGALEVEDFFKQGKSMKPLRHSGHDDMEPPICQDTGSLNSQEHQSGMVHSNSISRLNNNIHGYFDTPSSLSRFKIW
jgi:hypothetical protein